jgi:hypothetical protein
MAIAVIGGVVVSTILTLFVVPCAYSLFSAWFGGFGAEKGVRPEGSDRSERATEHAAEHANVQLASGVAEHARL